MEVVSVLLGCLCGNGPCPPVRCAPSLTLSQLCDQDTLKKPHILIPDTFRLNEGERSDTGEKL